VEELGGAIDFTLVAVVAGRLNGESPDRLF